jgi:phosphohistidine phosphatase
MRHLILVRHAKTEKDAESGRDQDRRLDKRGLADAGTIGAWLRENVTTPDLALVSTAARTRQTWDILAPYLPGCKSRFEDDLYLASAADIFRIIRKAPADVQTLLVLGHNPGLHELAWTLTGKAGTRDRDALAENLPTAGTVCLDFPINDWTRLSLHSGILSHFITPKHLKSEEQQ